MLLMFSEGQKMIDNGARELQLFELENGPLIHVEVNMEELPIFLFKSRDRVEESLQARNTIITEDGRRLDQYVKVTGGREFGLPGPADRDVYVAVMRHVHRNGGMPADGWVSFSIYGLLRMMGKNPRAGKNHDNVRDSLDRIADCVIYAENAFYNNEDQDFESHRFYPWSVHFKSKKRKKGREMVAAQPSRFIAEMALNKATVKEDPREKLKALRAAAAARAAQLADKAV